MSCHRLPRPLVSLRLTNGKVPTKSSPQCLLPHPNHPHFPSLHSSRNCGVWVPCHPQPRSDARAFVSEGPRLVRLFAQSTARIAHSCLPSRRQLGEDTQDLFDASVCFMSGWQRIGDRRTLEEFAFNRNQSGSLPTSNSTRAFFAHGKSAAWAPAVADWLDDLITWIPWPAVTHDGSLRCCCPPTPYYPTSPNFTEWIEQSAAGWHRGAEQQLCRSSRCCASLLVSLHTVRRNLRRVTGQGAKVKFVRRKLTNRQFRQLTLGFKVCIILLQDS